MCPWRKVEGWERWSIPPVASITWIMPDPESPVPSQCCGDADAPQLTWKTSFIGTQNGQRCLFQCGAAASPLAHGD